MFFFILLCFDVTLKIAFFWFYVIKTKTCALLPCALFCLLCTYLNKKLTWFDIEMVNKNINRRRFHKYSKPFNFLLFLRYA